MTTQGSDSVSSDNSPCRLFIPGGSPFKYVGDPSNDILNIVRIYVHPNPPYQDERTKFRDMTITIWGEFTAEIGDQAHDRFTISRNGTVWVGPEDSPLELSSVKITQPGWEPGPDTPPQRLLHKGPVQFQRRIPSPAMFFQKGHYTLRYEAFTADGSRITDIQATSWVEGHDRDLTSDDF